MGDVGRADRHGNSLLLLQPMEAESCFDTNERSRRETGC